MNRDLMTSTLRLVAAALCVVTLAACGGKSAAEQSGKGGPGGPGGPGGNRGPLEFPVEVQRVADEAVEYAVHAVGSVEAFEQIAVTARVSGVVDRVRFREGEVVRPGAVLLEIEPERYTLAVRSAQANVEKEQAALAEAKAGLERRQAASERNPGLIRGEEIETWRTRARTAEAQVAQARSSLDQAKLNLHDSFVRAPAGGVIQTRTVQTGQYVQPGTVLATLVRRDPLMLRFQVPEQESQNLRRGLPVKFSVAEAADTFDATITLVSEAANPASRMVVVTAQINDARRAELRPGAFARVTVPIGGTKRAPVVPQTAIRPSERGFLAYVVDGKVAHERVLELGLRTAAGKVEVRRGLQAGELLVVRGGEALREGAAVKVTQ